MAAGNVDLTAWTGLVLLVLFVGELLTLFDVRGLTYLLARRGRRPPGAPRPAEDGRQGWRVIGYYTGREPYRVAPRTVLRWLGIGPVPFGDE